MRRQTKKADSRIKGEENCPDPRGKNIQQGAYCRTALGSGTAVTMWGGG
jgi:hypothetical protein